LRFVAGVLAAVCAAAPSLLAVPKFSGTVEDRKGPVDGAQVSLWFYETGKGLQVKTVGGGFEISPMKEGNYFFRVEKDGQTPVYGAVRLFGGEEHHVKIYLRTKDPGEEVGADTSPAADTPDVGSKRIGGKVAETKRAKTLAPVYPADDKARRIQGDVVMSALISKSGIVEQLVVLASPDLGLALSSLASVRDWKYRPTELDGKAVEVITDITVHFRLE
jgi:TonB family protein